MTALEFALQNTEWIGYGVLVLGLGILACVEWKAPRSAILPDKRARWQANVLLYACGAVFMALVFESLSPHAIRFGSALGWGGIAAIDWPAWARILAGVLVVDLLQYGLHVASHYVPWWWRLHKIHHSDTSMDASTSIRHHPLEMLVNGLLLFVLCAALGVPLPALLLYMGLQLVHSLFCHGNIRLPGPVDRWLRMVLVTPDMHAVHHSLRADEGNSNFSMVFPWWDHVFRTYRAQPLQGHQAMRYGIRELAAERPLQLVQLLELPFWKAR